MYRSYVLAPVYAFHDSVGVALVTLGPGALPDPGAIRVGAAGGEPVVPKVTFTWPVAVELLPLPSVTVNVTVLLAVLKE